MSDNTNTEVLLAGAIAAFTIDLFVYPLDTIKTRVQSQDYIKSYASSAPTARSPAFAIRGLYQGVGSVIIATLPAAAVFFTVYESSKSALGSILPSAVPQPLAHSLASGVAELSSCLILTPAEVIKQNAQMIRRQGRRSGSRLSRSTSLQALAMVRDAPGGASRRLLGGYTALAGRNLPFTALQFPMFEAIRARAWKWADSRRAGGPTKDGGGGGRGMVRTGVVNGASAAISGCIAAFMTTPTDVVKTRMMLLGSEEKQEGLAKGRGRGAAQVAMMVYREKGVPGLFRGGLLRSSWAAVGSGMYLGSYEMAKVWLKKDRQLDGAL